MKPKYLIVLLIVANCLLPTANSFAQGTWIQRANHPGPGRLSNFAFAVNGKGYMGTGWNGNTSYDDFFEYDPITDSWTQKANVPGGARHFAMGFAIGNKGYAGTGSISILNKSFYEYDPATNIWTPKAPVPISIETVGAFVVGTKGYIVCGDSWGNPSYTQDMWVYDQPTDTWTMKACPFGHRSDIDRVPFVINNKAYLGMGDTAYAFNTMNDWWEYDPAINAWTQKANFPSSGRFGASGFALCNKGYAGIGFNSSGQGTSDWYQYDPVANSWAPIAPFPPGNSGDCPTFVIGNSAYVVGGAMPLPNDTMLWEYRIANTLTVTAVAATICAGQSSTITATGGNTYSWNIGATTSSIVVSPSATTSYNVADTTAPCGTGIPITITVLPSQTLTVSNISVCQGQTATLSASGGTNYSWSNGATTSSIVISPSTTTSYTVSIPNNPCTLPVMATVSVAPLPTGTMSVSPSLCSSANGSASVAMSSGTSPYTYNWSPSGGTGSAAINLSPGNYSVMLTDANGCANIYSVTVTSTGTPTVIVSSTQQTCSQLGTAATSIAGGSAPYTYLWSNGATTSQISNLAAQSYSVTVTDAKGCSVINSVTITASGNIPVATTTVTSTTCGNSNGSASVAVVGGTSPYTYLWSPSASAAATATGLSAGTYTVTVTDATGCSSMQTAIIAPSSAITATASSVPSCGVNSGTALVSAAGGSTPYSYTWSPSAAATATATGLSAGIYTCTITDAAGCTQTATVNVTVYPNPTATAFNNITITQGQSTTLAASGGGAYLWGEGDIDSIISVSPQSTTIYCVTVTNVFGCSDTACVLVTVEPIDCSESVTGPLAIPNAFSPNGDGQNDRIKLLYGNMACIKTYKLVIYNRWGEKIFETTDALAQWDGSYSDQAEGTAVFAWYIKAELVNGDKIERKGNISLIR